jgi:hypothetical protein
MWWNCTGVLLTNNSMPDMEEEGFTTGSDPFSSVAEQLQICVHLR